MGRLDKAQLFSNDSLGIPGEPLPARPFSWPYKDYAAVGSSPQEASRVALRCPL